MDNKGIKYVVIGVVLIIIISMTFLVSFFIRDMRHEDLEEQWKEDISFKAPDKFEKEDGYMSTYYRYEDSGVFCHFYISSFKKREYSGKYEGAKEILESTVPVYLNEKVSGIEETMVGNKEGYYVKVTGQRGTNYYYTVEGTNYIFKIEYEIDDYDNGDRGDIDTNICYNSLDSFINSIVVK